MKVLNHVLFFGDHKIQYVADLSVIVSGRLVYVLVQKGVSDGLKKSLTHVALTFCCGNCCPVDAGHIEVHCHQEMCRLHLDYGLYYLAYLLRCWRWGKMGSDKYSLQLGCQSLKVLVSAISAP